MLDSISAGYASHMYLIAVNALSQLNTCFKKLFDISIVMSSNVIRFSLWSLKNVKSRYNICRPFAYALVDVILVSNDLNLGF